MAGYQAYVAVDGKVQSTASGLTYDQNGVKSLADICIRDVLEGDGANLDIDLNHLAQLLRAGHEAAQQAQGAA